MLRIFRHYVSSAALSLLLLDTIVIGIILLGVSFLSETRILPLPADQIFGIGLAAVTAVLILVMMFSTGVYDKSYLGDYRHLSSRLLVCLVVSLGLFAIAYSANPEGVREVLSVDKFIFAGAVISVFPAIMLTRVVYVFSRRRLGANRRILVLGTGGFAGRIEAIAARDLSFSSEIVGYMATTNEAVKVPQNKVLNTTLSLSETCAALGINEIVVSLQDRRGMPMEQLLECRMRGITVTSMLSFWERETRRVMLDALDPSWLVYSEGFGLNALINSFLKRSFDVVVSLAFLLLVLPLLAAAAIAVRLDSPGSILYKQERVGRNGRNFVIYKLRTMRQDAEKDNAPQWASARDPRVTKVGAFLRLTRIDEIPQIFNVLRGDMSVVGPRPERPFFVDMLAKDIPYYRERLRLRPGITGWAQINYPYGASIDDAKAKLSYDLYYIKNFSILFDFLVMFATVQVILWNKGAR